MAGYLKWIAENTDNRWWCDGAILSRLEEALPYGAVGVTSNPKLAREGYEHDWDYWQPRIQDLKDLKGDEKSLALYQRIITPMAKRVEPIYHATNGRDGYACVQMSPLLAADTQGMIEMARRVNKWAPNLSIKIPCTMAGINAIETLSSEGIGLTVTMGFAMAEMIGVAEAYEKGRAKAIAKGIKPRHCHAVFFAYRAMYTHIARIIMERDNQVVTPRDIELGVGILIKRALNIYEERGYHAEIFGGGLTYDQLHMMAGAKMLIVMPWINAHTADKMIPPEGMSAGYRDPMPWDSLERLMTIPEFRRMYEDDGLPPEKWFTDGPMQWAIAEFIGLGWLGLQGLKI